MTDTPDKKPDTPDKIVLYLNDTPSGRLLARAIEITDETGCTMGEAMDRAQYEADNNILPERRQP